MMGGVLESPIAIVTQIVRTIGSRGVLNVHGGTFTWPNCNVGQSGSIEKNKISKLVAERTNNVRGKVCPYFLFGK